MTKSKWALITSILIIVYGALLLFQACWPGWDIAQASQGLITAKIVGGIVLISWAIVFFKLKR